MYTQPIDFAKIFKELKTVYDDIESARDVIIPTTVRNFIEAVFLESLIFRSRDWYRKHKMDINKPSELEKTIPILGDAIRAILEEVQPEDVQGIKYLPIINVLDIIQDKWCNIWPFCR